MEKARLEELYKSKVRTELQKKLGLKECNGSAQNF